MPTASLSSEWCCLSHLTGITFEGQFMSAPSPPCGPQFHHVQVGVDMLTLLCGGGVNGLHLSMPCIQRPPGAHLQFTNWASCCSERSKHCLEPGSISEGGVGKDLFQNLGLYWGLGGSLKEAFAPDWMLSEAGWILPSRIFLSLRRKEDKTKANTAIDKDVVVMT